LSRRSLPTTANCSKFTANLMTTVQMSSRSLSEIGVGSVRGPCVRDPRIGCYRSWRTTGMGTNNFRDWPVENYIKQYYIHKFCNFLGSRLFNHQIIYSYVHFAVLTLKLPTGTALSHCLYLWVTIGLQLTYFGEMGICWKVTLVGLGRSDLGRKPVSIICVSFLDVPSWNQFDMASYTFGVRYRCTLP
jgi:hypothetical protein